MGLAARGNSRNNTSTTLKWKCAASGFPSVKFFPLNNIISGCKNYAMTGKKQSIIAVLGTGGEPHPNASNNLD